MVRVFAEGAVGILNRVGSFLEPQMLAGVPETLEHAPLFIIGPPRSGTTLFYQLMTRNFGCSYLTNFACRLRGAPVLASRLGRRVLRPHETSFASRYGYEVGPQAPNEGGPVWNRWFPTEDRQRFNYTDESYLDVPTKALIRRTVAALEQMVGEPFVSKNTKHSVRIRALADLFPNALFIQVRRDLLDVAVSILEARRSVKGSRDKWLWTMPSAIADLRREGWARQIVGQVHHIEEDIERDIRAVGPERRLVVDYLQMCESPGQMLDEVAGFYLDRTGEALRLTKAPLPVLEPSRRKSAASQDEIEELASEWERVRCPSMP